MIFYVKKVQKTSDPPQTPSEYDQPILCDGCDRMIDEEHYIQHWEKCIHGKRIQLRKEREGKRREEQTKKQLEQEQKDIEEQIRMNEQRKKKIEEQGRQQKQHKAGSMLKNTCQKCGQEIPPLLCSLQNHKFVCIEREQTCQFCNGNFPNYLMQEHHQVCEIRSAILNSTGQHGMSRQVSKQRKEHIRMNNPRGQPNPFAPRPAQPSGQVPPNGNMQGYTLFSSQDPRLQALLPPQLIQQLHCLQQNGVQFFIDSNGRLVFIQSQGQTQGQNQGSSNLDLLQDFYQSLKPKQKFSQSQMNSLKKSKFWGDFSDDSCTLCMQYFKKGDETFVTECKHTFHYKCIRNWLKNAVTCPNCMSNLKQKS